MRLVRNLILGGIIWSVLCFPVMAEDTFGSVLARLKVTQASKYVYSETRQLQLLSQLWNGKGKMYLSPTGMVIEQTIPARSIIILTEKTLRYVEPDNNVLYLKLLKAPFALPGMGAFLNILYGDHSPESLQAEFSTVFETQKGRWTISLVPNSKDDIQEMQISGEVDKNADYLSLEFVDGDRTTWEMKLKNTGDIALDAMNTVKVFAESVKRTPKVGER